MIKKKKDKIWLYHTEKKVTYGQREGGNYMTTNRNIVTDKEIKKTTDKSEDIFMTIKKDKTDQIRLYLSSVERKTDGQ